MSTPACPRCGCPTVRDAVSIGRRCTGKLRWLCVVCKGRSKGAITSMQAKLARSTQNSPMGEKSITPA